MKKLYYILSVSILIVSCAEEKTVETIVKDLDGHIYDLIFQAVCDEMNEHYVFDSSEYLTESGLELFEDEWFEFYHENHGKIIHKLIQKLK